MTTHTFQIGDIVVLDPANGTSCFDRGQGEVKDIRDRGAFSTPRAAPNSECRVLWKSHDTADWCAPEDLQLV